jgi:diacylglycerol kinase (ATP)
MRIYLFIFDAMKKLIRSFGFAFKGLGYAAKTQLNFRIHMVATVIAIFMGCVLHISTNEWLWIGLCVALVLITELLNTSLEFLTDLVSPDYNELAGHVKDIGAGAVVIAAVFALVTGAVIFLPKLLLLIHYAT